LSSGPPAVNREWVAVVHRRPSRLTPFAEYRSGSSVGSVPLLLRTLLVTLMRTMNEVLQALADPSRRTVLEILRSHPATAGELAAALPIARPGVSRHLRVLREVGLVDVRQDAQRRVYTLRPEALVEVDQWLEPYRALWRNRLDALHTEIARGKKERK
jgi:DNA-binding transcriptional ArsR family regulator